MKAFGLVFLAVAIVLVSSIPAATQTAGSYPVKSLVRVNGCLVVERDGGFVLSSPTDGRSLVQTEEAFRPPLVVTLRAKTDSTNLRLYYSAGMVIFNWECRPDQLRVHDPLTDRTKAVNEKGLIATNEWHDVTWEIMPDWMRISVDDEVRYEGPGEYSTIEAPVGIGPAYGSVISVASFTVEAR